MDQREGAFAWEGYLEEVSFEPVTRRNKSLGLYIRIILVASNSNLEKGRKEKKYRALYWLRQWDVGMAGSRASNDIIRNLSPSILLSSVIAPFLDRLPPGGFLDLKLCNSTRKTMLLFF